MGIGIDIGSINDERTGRSDIDPWEEEPWTRPIYTRESLKIESLKNEIADLKADIIALQNLIRDLDFCRMHWCDNGCSHFKGGDSFCGLEIDKRLVERGL